MSVTVLEPAKMRYKLYGVQLMSALPLASVCYSKLWNQFLNNPLKFIQNFCNPYLFSFSGFWLYFRHFYTYFTYVRQ